MATFGKYFNAFLSVGGTDLSDHVKSVQINYSADMLDSSCMGNATKINLAGLLNWSINVEFLQEYGSTKTDDKLFPLIGAAGAEIIVKPTNTDVGATNPTFTGTGLLTSYNPASGAHGSLHTATATFQAAGTLVRATA